MDIMVKRKERSTRGDISDYVESLDGTKVITT